MASRGLSSLIPGLTISALMLILTAILTIKILDLVEVSATYNVGVTEGGSLRVLRAIYSEDLGGPSLNITLANTGSTTLINLDKLEVIVSYKSSGMSKVELLKFTGSKNWTPGYWVVTGVIVGDRGFTYEPRLYLRPGEAVEITAFLSSTPDPGSIISIAVISPEGVKAEYSTVR